MPVTFDVSTYGATGNPAQDVTPFLDMIRSDALAWQTANPGGGLITVNFPFGQYDWGSGGSTTSWLRGLKNVKITCNGSTMTASGAAFYATGWDTGHPIQAGTDVLSSARCETCHAGERTITIIDPARISNFAVGQIHLMTGLAVYFNGYPTTHHFFEYVRITQISGLTITIQDPLKFTYRKTWPCYSIGTGGSPDNGGPGTLYKFDQSWDQAIEWVGASFDPTTTPMQSSCREITYTTCTWTGSSSGALVTMVKTCIFRQGCSMPGIGQEIDKYVDTLIYDASGHHQIFIQTSAVNYMYMRNGAYSEGATSTINGTAKKMYVEGATTHLFSVLLGAYNFGGISYEFHWTDAQIDAIGWGGWNTIPIANLHSYATCAGGVITWNLNDTYLACGQVIVPSWAIPDAYFVMGGGVTYQAELAFKVLSITGENDASASQDVSTQSNLIYITTNIPDGWPTNFDGGNAYLFIGTHACPSFTVSNPQGLAAVQFAGMPSGSQPFGQYWSRTITEFSGPYDIPNFVWGHLARMHLDILVPWTGDFSGFEIYPFHYTLAEDGTEVDWNPHAFVNVARVNTLEPVGYTAGGGSNGAFGPPPWNFHFPMGMAMRPRFDPIPIGFVCTGYFSLQTDQHITYVSPYWEDMVMAAAPPSPAVLLGQIVM